MDVNGGLVNVSRSATTLIFQPPRLVSPRQKFSLTIKN